jgi:hypothetical protein
VAEIGHSGLFRRLGVGRSDREKRPGKLTGLGHPDRKVTETHLSLIGFLPLLALPLIGVRRVVYTKMLSTGLISPVEMAAASFGKQPKIENQWLSVTCQGSAMHQ